MENTSRWHQQPALLSTHQQRHPARHGTAQHGMAQHGMAPHHPLQGQLGTRQHPAQNQALKGPASPGSSRNARRTRNDQKFSNSACSPRESKTKTPVMCRGAQAACSRTSSLLLRSLITNSVLFDCYPFWDLSDLLTKTALSPLIKGRGENLPLAANVREKKIVYSQENHCCTLLKTFRKLNSHWQTGKTRGCAHLLELGFLLLGRQVQVLF